jgi:hypothetical protein
VDHQDWGDWGDGDGDGDYSGDAETAELGGPDEPLASGLGGYEDHGAYQAGEHGLDPGADAGPDHGPAGAGGGFLEDDPMGALGADHGPDHGPDAGPDADADADAGSDPGSDLGSDPGHDADTGEPGHAYLTGADGEPDDGGGHGTDVPPDTADGPDASTEPHPETVVGADPDVDPDADWAPADFPEQLDFAAPEPVDGYPWSDPSAVAAPGTGGEDPAHGPDGSPPAQDLLDYAGADGDGDPWAALVGSDDPATSSLGRWWAPGT